MAIDFEEQRWDYIKSVYSKWWAGTLKRPIIPVIIKGRKPERSEPITPLLSQETSLDFSYSAEDIIDRIDYELSQNIYLGDAFPYFNMDCFGPGVLAAFLGAKADNATGNIWFFPETELELKDMHFTYQPDNAFFKRVKDIYRVGVQRWNGRVVMGMVDLGGVLDVLATFRSTEKLLMDLYDQPEEVLRLVQEIHELWLRYFKELNEILALGNNGYSDWAKIYSEQPTYVIQCDFSYMISTKMFVKFAKNELEMLAQKIPNTIYHLDGPGEIKHLEQLLQIKEINAIQWVPGAGSPPQTAWPEIYQKIAASGKGIQLWEGFETLDIIAEQIGSYQGLLHWEIYEELENLDTVLHKLKKYEIA
ncbi:MAG: hypothetical protein WCI30_06310 [Clostridia bacterium]